MPVVNIQSAADLLAAQATSPKTVLFFWAAWHEPSRQGGQMQSSFSALADKYASSITFILIEAEAVPEVSEKFEVSVVPTFLSCVQGNVVEKVEGASPAELNTLVKKLNVLDAKDFPTVQASTSSSSVAPTKVLTEEERKAKLNARLEKLINAAPVMLFMKGSSSQPKCGFSRQLVEILQGQQIPFASFDILSDEEVRAGLKVYSDWPTYPQLYVHGNLVGGLDIVKDMIANTESTMKEQLGIQDLTLPTPPSVVNLQDRLKALINTAPVMLFMKGSPAEPRCGFSRQIVDILKTSSIEFSHFDILSDEEVRAGLKEYSDWPTYPQLYVNGALAGGLDIVKEMIADGGNLKEQLGL
jgi:Grx4 family monothiol glutaredoxin